MEKSIKEKPSKQKEIPKDLWIKCDKCGEVMFQKDFVSDLKVCRKCDFHYPLNAWERVDALMEKDTFKEIDNNLYSLDPLEFGEGYRVKLLKDRKKNRS